MPRRRFWQSLLFPLALVALPCLVGCGEAGPARYDVSGTVSYQGKPLPAGLIMFDPDITKGNDGPQGFAHIKDGRYNTAETESGPVGGPHIVRIQGFDGVAGQELPMGRPLFTDYQTPADIPAETSTLDFEVPPQ